MATDSSLRQTGLVGPWRPAFLLSISMLVMTLSVIYWNEQTEGPKFCQAPGFSDSTYGIVVMTVGATVGHFIIQLSGAYSKYGSNKHTSASMMILLITGIQAASQVAMVSNVVKLSCEDYFGVRTSMFLWVEWMATVPIMFYLTSILDVNKFQLTQEDQIVIFAATFGLFCLYLLSFGTVSPAIAIFLMIIANLFMTAALFWLHGSSYYAHLAAVKKAKKFPDEAGPLSSLYIQVKQRKLLCAGFMNYFFTLFPIAYFLKCADIIDHDTFYVSFAILNFLCKGIFATLVTDSHSELLDPKTFLLFSEKERMESSRRAFMRYVFHEIHVPLKSVTLGLKLLNESQEVTETDRETLNMVKDASDLMTETLNDVLAIHKIEEGKLILSMKPFHIVDLIHHAKSCFRHLIITKRIRASDEMGADVPDVVIGDRAKLEHVLDRLIGNAIRRCDEEGKVSLSVSYGTKEEGCVTFSIKDSGPGIPLEEQDSVFKRLVQMKPDDLQEGKPQGMDLAVCKEIVAMHGGIIGCVSNPRVKGQEGESWSDFFFSIKFEVSEEKDDDSF